VGPLRLTLVLVLCTALAGGCGSSINKATGGRTETPVLLTLANLSPGSADIGEWVNAVERLSRGSIRIEIRSDWRNNQADRQTAVIGDVRDGRVDLAKVFAGSWARAGVHSFDALLAPSLVTTYDLERRVAASGPGQQMLNGVGAAGVVGLALQPGELQRPVGFTHDLLRLVDYEGARIAVRSEPAAAAMRALGARPLLVDTGRFEPSDFDGAALSPVELDIDGYGRQARSATADVVLWPRATTVVMNRKSYAHLSLDQREALRKAATASLPKVLERLRTWERGARESLCARGFEFAYTSPRERDAIDAATRPVFDRLRSDPATRELLGAIEAMKGRARPEPLSPCTQPEQAVRKPSPLDGTWRARVSKARLVAAGDDWAAQNFGDYALTFRAGRFGFRIARFPGRDAGTGRFSVNRDVITFKAGGTLEMGGGETWRYRWTLYRGTLAFKRIGDAGPTAFIVQPWQRAG
jgi:TRAP-type C4-dicarboxylate transport system substrate-binding protein